MEIHELAFDNVTDIKHTVRHSTVTLTESETRRLQPVDHDALAEAIYHERYNELDSLIEGLIHFETLNHREREIAQMYRVILLSIIKSFDNAGEHKQLLAITLYHFFERMVEKEIEVDLAIHIEMTKAIILAMDYPLDSLCVLRHAPENEYFVLLCKLCCTAVSRKPKSDAYNGALVAINDLFEGLESFGADPKTRLEIKNAMAEVHLIIQSFSIKKGKAMSAQFEVMDWMDIRAKFECIWKFVNEIQVNKAKLFVNLVTICQELGECEYAWFKFESSHLQHDWQALLAMAQLCKIAAQEFDRELWIARMWALYRHATDTRSGAEQCQKFITIVKSTLNSTERITRRMTIVNDPGNVCFFNKNMIEILRGALVKKINFLEI
jgi:hypothetical protein